MHLLLSPLSWAVLLLAWRAATRAAWLRRLQAAGLLACWVMAAPLGANALVWLIEQRLQAAPPCGASEASPLLMLTGGLAQAPRDADDFGALSPASLRRVAALVQLARSQPTVPVYISGGPVGAMSEARLAGALAERLGVAPARLHLEMRSTTTWQNAEEVASLLPQGVRRVQLVTSDLHAPRAALALRAWGIAACRHPADSDFTPPTGLGYLAPQSTSLAKAERALHELAGLASYASKSAPGR